MSDGRNSHVQGIGTDSNLIGDRGKIMCQSIAGYDGVPVCSTASCKICILISFLNAKNNLTFEIHHQFMVKTECQSKCYVVSDKCFLKTEKMLQA